MNGDCADSIHNFLGPDAVVCDRSVCDQARETALYRRICSCLDWNGNPIPNCQPKEPGFPFEIGQCSNSQTGEIVVLTPGKCGKLGEPWVWQECFCCCFESVGADTSIAVPEGERAASDVKPGDDVLTARRGDGGSLSWTPSTVAFAGSGAAIAVRVDFGARSTIAPTDRLFLQPTGRLRRADELAPGTDALVDPDGRALPVRSVERGSFPGAIRQLAVALPSYEEFDGPDDHLIATDGVVAGDYVTQLYQHTEKMAPHVEPARALAGATPHNL